MNSTKAVICGVAVAMGVAGTLAVQAQQTGFTRTPVQQGDLSIPGREAVQAIATIQAGAESGRHTHPGEEFGYVLEGAITIELQGKSVTKKAGEGFIIPPGTVHNAKNASSAPAKVLATYIVEKGKPVATPVP